MKAHYDPEVDALAINWGDTSIAESDEVEPGVILDYDEAGNVVGVEILDAFKKIQNLSSTPLSTTSTSNLS
jgi:uncharacterized protein YuzE